MNTDILYEPIDYNQFYLKKLQILGPIEQQSITQFVQKMCMGGSSLFDINITLAERITSLSSEMGLNMTDEELEDINIVKHCAIQSLLN